MNPNNNNNNSFGAASSSNDDLVLSSTLQEYLNSSFDFDSYNNVSQVSSLGSFLEETQELSIVSSSSSSGRNKKRKHNPVAPSLSNLSRPIPGVKIVNAKQSKHVVWKIDLGYSFRLENFFFCNFNYGNDSIKASDCCNASYYTPDSSTNNMTKHLLKSHNLNESKAKQMWEQAGRPLSAKNPNVNSIEKLLNVTAGSGGSNKYVITRDDVRKAVIQMIVKHSLPYSFVESADLQNLLNVCRRTQSERDVQLVSANTVKKDIQQYYNELKVKMTTYLSQQQFISFTCDVWTSTTNVDFLGIIAHFIDCNWEPKQVVIGFEELKSKHTGEYLAEVFMQVLRDFKIESKLFCITTDNGSNMGKMMTEISKLTNMRFDKQENWISCIGHVINLSCQQLLTKGLNVQAPTSDSSIYNVAETIEADVSDAYQFNPILKLRRGIVKIRASHNLSRLYEEACDAVGIKHQKLAIDVRTRWNSTKQMIGVGLKMKAAYKRTCARAPLNTGLHNFELNNDEIQYLEKVHHLLDPFEQATLWVSGQRYPTVNRAVMICNALLDHLDNILVDHYPSSTCQVEDVVDKIEHSDELMHFDLGTQRILTGAYEARKKLIQYYTATDNTSVYSIVFGKVVVI